MDATQNKHAYHCMPVTLANTNGWVVELEEKVVVTWEGGQALPKILAGQATPIAPGIIGFSIGWTIEAPDLEVSYGPVPNWPQDNQAYCLTAIVDGTWPDPVQANWLIPPNKEITFEQNTPICFISLQQKYLMEEIVWSVNERHLETDWQKQRMQYRQEKKRKLEEKPWMGWTKTIRQARPNLPKLPDIG